MIVALVALLTGFMSTIVEPAYAATIPSAPLGVVARGGDAVGTMTVTWLKPTNLGAASKPRYFVAKATENGAFGVAVDTGTNKSVILPCTGATKCRFVVYAQTKAGRGPGSAIATGTWARPAAPAIKSVTAGPALGRMTVSINSPANTGGKTILGYLYDFQVNGAGAWVGPFAVPTLPTAPARVHVHDPERWLQLPRVRPQRARGERAERRASQGRGPFRAHRSSRS